MKCGAALYGEALKKAEAACGMKPGNTGFLTTLGIAQYRVQRYETALATLLEAERLASFSEAGEEDPIRLAFTSMTLHRLGRTREALDRLERLKTLMSLEARRNHKQGLAFLQEAETLMARE